MTERSTGPSTPALVARGVSKTFPGTRALIGFDFTVEAGELHALVGHNGSGKSTFIKVLSGFHEPDDGAIIEVAGTRLQLGSPSASRACGLRFIHQDLGLVEELSAVENIGLGRGFETGALGRIRWRQERVRASERLAALGFDFDVSAPVRELRAAERTGVAITRALYDSDQARVLVVDEPTAVLPRADAEALFNAIRRVQSQGVGVVYVSHRLDEVFRIADVVSVLRDGERVGTFPTSELDQDRLIDLMVGGEDLRAVAPDDERHAGDVLLQVTDLCGGTVNGATLEARGGEILGIAGLTGSGRDELLSLIFGATQRTGQVRVDSKEVNQANPSDSIAAGMAMVQADRRGKGAIPALTVRENCTITDLRRLSGLGGTLRRTEETREVAGWIASLDIRPSRPEELFATLSGGNQQKVVLAKWLRMKPRVLLLDEPTQGVDVHAKATIHGLGRDVSHSGSAVVVASSDDTELCDWCDRVLVFAGGTVVTELSGAQLTPDRLARAQFAA